MSRSLPPLGWFRAFECAARQLSFTVAANELGMTQSAVSQQIRLLESRFGCRLFIRKHRGLALTDEGRRLLPEVTRAIDAFRSATAPFEKSAQPDVLTVATSVSVAQWYLAPAMRCFVEENPDFQIRLLTSVWPDELADSADVQIRFGSAKDDEADYLPLGGNEMVMVASPQLLGSNYANNKANRKAGSKTSNKAINLTDEQLQRYPLIEAVGTSDTWPNSAAAFGLHNSHQATLSVDSHGLAVDLAISGSGVALTSKLIAMPAIKSGLLIQVNPKSIAARDGYFIAVTSQQHAVSATAFVDWILKLV